MVTYHDYAKDLRALADLFDTHADDLPLPHYAEQGLDIQIHVAELADVSQAAKALDVQISDKINPSVDVDVESVSLRFVWVAPAQQAKWQTRQDFAATMPEGWPGSVLAPRYAPAQVPA